MFGKLCFVSALHILAFSKWVLLPGYSQGEGEGMPSGEASAQGVKPQVCRGASFLQVAVFPFMQR